MIRKIVGIGILAIIVLIVCYGGLVIYGNVTALKGNSYSLPDMEEAQYSVRVQNTGLYLYSDDVNQDGDIIVIDGYWELVGQKFKYREATLILDKGIFGEIRVSTR